MWARRAILLALLAGLAVSTCSGRELSSWQLEREGSRALLQAAPEQDGPEPPAGAPPAAPAGTRGPTMPPAPGPDRPERLGVLAKIFFLHRDRWTWDGRNIAGVVLSIIISMLSSIDREAGAGLYLVLFSALLEFPLREAIALTAFCTFLGTLGPGIAATREAVSTERGPMAAVDYASAILILPGMYYGISYGVIINAIIPMWLLALLVVVSLAISNAQLLISIASMIGAKRQILRMADQIKEEAQALAVVASGDPDLLGTDAVVVPGGGGGGGGGSDADSQAAGGGGKARAALCCGGGLAAGAGGGANGSSEAKTVAQRRADLERLRARVRKLHRRATKIEALALLFPAFHFPTHHEIARDARADVDTIFGEGHGLSREPQRADAAAEAALEASGAGARRRGGAAAGPAAAKSAPSAASVSASEWGSSDAGGGGCSGKREKVWTNVGGVPITPPPLPEGRLGHLRRWWGLQPKFEFAMVIKIVVLHLLTEFVRHWRAHPCTKRFWFMLIVMAGLVTILLMAICASFCRKRLWRGPRWLGAQREVQAARAAEEAAGDPELAAAGAAGAAESAPGREERVPAGFPKGYDPEPAGAAAAPKALPDVVAAPRHHHHCHHRHPAGAAGAGAGAAAGAVPAAPPPTRNPFVKFGRAWAAHSPFRTGTPAAAIKNEYACVSQDGFRRWTIWRMVLTEVLAFPLGVLACALGLPGGPGMASLMLALRIKPHIVAATSRYLTMTMTFGSFVAYIIAGNLRFTYALAYGLINLVVAPLGMALFQRAQLPSHVLLTASAAMGLAAMGALIGTELVPWMARFDAEMHGLEFPRDENLFNWGRFCFPKHYRSDHA